MFLNAKHKHSVTGSGYPGSEVQTRSHLRVSDYPSQLYVRNLRQIAASIRKMHTLEVVSNDHTVTS